MQFPLSDTSASPWWLLLLGFTAGSSSGFWGVGGGWVITPALFILGFPLNIAVGTSLAFIYGQSIVSTLKHRELGNVHLPLGLILSCGMIPGVEVGVRVIQRLKKVGEVEKVLGTFYIFFLLAIFIFTLWESLKAKRQTEGDKAVIRFKQPLQWLSLPPYIQVKEENVPVTSVLGVGFITGFFAGLLGIGGGIINLPLLIYVIGLPTKEAVGTSLLSILIAGAYGTFSHSWQGNVEIIATYLLLAGGLVGARIGSLATRYTPGVSIRLLFSLGIGATSLSVALRMMGKVTISFLLIFGVAIIMCVIILAYLLRGVYERRNNNKVG